MFEFSHLTLLNVLLTVGSGMGNELLAELEVMQSISYHLNVIELIPCHLQSPTICIVMEYAERGNLKKILTIARETSSDNGYLQPQGCPIRTSLGCMDQLNAASQVACGMAHIAAHGVSTDANLFLRNSKDS
jgi:serine/threonine protein kinase